MSSVFKTANVSNLASKTGGFYIAVLLVPPTRGKRSVRSRAIVRQRRAGVHSLLELFGLGHGEHAEALELDVGHPRGWRSERHRGRVGSVGPPKRAGLAAPHNR
jgi:hypothetical protein